MYNYEEDVFVGQLPSVFFTGDPNDITGVLFYLYMQLRLLS